MVSSYRLTQLDESNREVHTHIGADDVCYFFGEYTSGEGYRYSDTNSLISNLKKPPSRRSNPLEWQHKENAIQICARLMRAAVKEANVNTNVTFVPIPPSKTRDHPEYDDRLVQILSVAYGEYESPDIRELIQQKESMEAAHHGGDRHDPQELLANYDIVAPVDYRPREHIILFDDVLTAGAHFRACNTILEEHYPDSQVVGIFVARRVFPPTNFDEVFGGLLED